MPIRVTPCSWRYAASASTLVVVPHVLVAVGDHRPAPVPPLAADDVHLAGEEGVGRADDRADVEVVLPVLDGDVEVVAPGVEVGHDRLDRPVAVAVDDVAAVALAEQLRVVLLARRQRSLPRPDADLLGTVRHRVVRRPLLAPAVGLAVHRRKRRARQVGVRSARIPSAGDHTRCCSGSSGWTPSGCSTSSAPRSSGSACVIIVVECGLFFPFLPGDTLLFAIGLFIARGDITVVPGGELDRTWSSRWSCSSVGAFAGNVIGYEIGRWIGPPLYERDGRILKRKYFDKTRAFFDKHGNKALVIGRFVPFVRTYITVVAGVTRMRRRRFFLWSAVGAVAWVAQHHPARLLPRPLGSLAWARTSTRRSWRSWPSR